MSSLAAALTDKEMEAIDLLLLQLAERLDEDTGEENNCILSITELDGFLTAILCTPSMLLASQWLPQIWGGVMPTFESEKEANRVINLVMRHMNSIAADLRPDPSRFNPVFSYREVDGVEYEIVDDWCHGFMRGVLNNIDSWQASLDDPEGPLLPILLFGTEKGWEIIKDMAEDETAVFRKQISQSVQRLARKATASTASAHPASGAPLRNEIKTGRNAPCPCGSGRKFKHCCLQ